MIPWTLTERGDAGAGSRRSPEPDRRRTVRDEPAPGRDVVAGMLLVNTVPHALVGLTGHRCRTPWGGVSSTCGQNMAWAALNLGGAVALLRSSRPTSQAAADRQRVRVGVGMCAMAVFGVIYDASSPGRRDRRVRSTRPAGPAVPGRPRGHRKVGEPCR